LSDYGVPLTRKSKAQGKITSKYRRKRKIKNIATEDKRATKTWVSVLQKMCTLSFCRQVFLCVTLLKKQTGSGNRLL